MSEVKLISPLLDGFSVGNPISEHHGVRCCPAIKENTDKKYILKIISVPATQTQMDALLLTGAYKDPAAAMDYFRKTGEEIMAEAGLLKKLSKLDGFLPYEGWQMEPITRRRLGYEVYLLGSYKRSLDKFCKKHPMTHKEAMDLAMDLCAALSVCRDSGALYVALKPSNVFVSEKKEYRIGDIGFVDLNALGYTVLPEKYHSAYTPPELFDPMASMNLTIDTYAVGMILYQLYNDGQLPFKGLRDPEAELPTPVNADYELAEIIMKAIHTDHTQRWDDPKVMGKALAAYMQKNAVNDVPITPHTPLDIKPEDITSLDKEQAESETIPSVKQAPDADALTQAAELIPDSEEAGVSPEQPAENNAALLEPPAEVTPSIEEAFADQSEDATEEDTSTENGVSQVDIIDDHEVSNDTPCEGDSEEIPIEEAPMEEVIPAPVLSSEEALIDEVSHEKVDAFSEELNRMLAKADDLIAYEPPAELTSPVAVTMEDPFSFVEEDAEIIDDSFVPEEPDVYNDEASLAEPETKKKRKKAEKSFADPKYKRRRKRIASFFITLLLFAAIGAGGFWYYQNYYLQTIHAISIEGTQDQITVTVDSNVQESMLLVRCLDQYGKADTKIVTNGKVTFTNLLPNTMYTIQLEVDGFHKLVGKTSDVYTTDATTKILSFTSAAGAEDGSVVLSFTMDGEEPKDWTVYYSAEGTEEVRQTFTGHSVTINDLDIGKTYTFRLDPGENIALGGQTTLEYMASRLILAEDLAVSSTTGTDITVTWDVPGDIVVDSWDVRCYNDAGYDEEVTVEKTQVQFFGIDPASSYTIEVTASGMTEASRIGISANPLTVTDLTVEETKANKLTVNWTFNGQAPKDGWLLIYSLAGGEKHVVKCPKATGEITPCVPGAKYDLLIQSTDGSTVFNAAHSYTAAAAESFNKNGLTADMLSVKLLSTPAEQNWRVEKLAPEAFKNSFTSGERISIALESSGTFYLPGSETKLLYVIHDSYGNLLSDLVAEETFYWKNLWNGGDVKLGELNLPQAPTASGSYTLSLYFDGMLAGQADFTISN
ncbi:MAG: fibronectin type III domain-containing protein [Oscillospiraceae bacterium]|nr:fibronectin type III domain-containing protein [Oscillospiraceae bacterium]